MWTGYDMNEHYHGNMSHSYKARFSNRENGDYQVLTSTFKEAFDEKIKEFERTHDMSCWQRIPDFFLYGICLPKAWGLIKAGQDENDPLLYCDYSFPDGTSRCFEGKSVMEIRLRIAMAYYEPMTHSHEEQEEAPQFPLNDYTIINYMWRYIKELKVITEEKLAKKANCSKSTICRLTTGTSSIYSNRKRMLAIGFGLELPKVDLLQFITAAAPNFPCTSTERSIMEDIRNNKLDYNKFINMIM